MDSGDLRLERRIDKTVASEGVLLDELGGDDHGLKGLTTAAYSHAIEKGSATPQSKVDDSCPDSAVGLWMMGTEGMCIPEMSLMST